MRIDNRNFIFIDSKIQDKFRERLAHVDLSELNLKCVVLGDSDFDYANSMNHLNTRILNAPYNVESVKYPLFYEGANSGLNGFISCFARKVYETTEGAVIQSYYEYPFNEDYTLGLEVPTLANGKHINMLSFDDSKSGYILYLQTILYNYIDEESDLMQRMNEKILIKIFFNDIEYIADGWDVVFDNDVRDIVQDGEIYTIHNNSLLISKDFSEELTYNSNGRIELVGELSNIKKTIYFNI